MIELPSLLGSRKTLRILCIGAHSDDIEIGCGATLLRLANERRLDVTWLILSSDNKRGAESRASAALFLKGARSRAVQLGSLRDGHLPTQWAEAKDMVESLKSLPPPDLIFTHDMHDRHQDHRVVSELTWNTFRNHTIFEYEIPKFDGGLGQPNLYAPVTRALAERKSRYLLSAYQSQRKKRWFTRETFFALLRLRGVECNSPSGLAEAFHARKLVI